MANGNSNPIDDRGTGYTIVPDPKPKPVQPTPPPAKAIKVEQAKAVEKVIPKGYKKEYYADGTIKRAWTEQTYRDFNANRQGRVLIEVPYAEHELQFSKAGKLTAEIVRSKYLESRGNKQEREGAYEARRYDYDVEGNITKYQEKEAIGTKRGTDKIKPIEVETYSKGKLASKIVTSYGAEGTGVVGRVAKTTQDFSKGVQTTEYFDRSTELRKVKGIPEPEKMEFPSIQYKGKEYPLLDKEFVPKELKEDVVKGKPEVLTATYKVGDKSYPAYKEVELPSIKVPVIETKAIKDSMVDFVPMKDIKMGPSEVKFDPFKTNIPTVKIEQPKADPLSGFKKRIEGIGKREEQFDKFMEESKGMGRIRGMASELTGGKGKPIEERSFVGQVAEKTVGGLMSWPIALGGAIPLATEKVLATGEALFHKETRKEVWPELKRTGKVTVKETYGYDIDTKEFKLTPEVASTYLTAGTFGLVGASGAILKGKGGAGIGKTRIKYESIETPVKYKGITIESGPRGKPLLGVSEGKPVLGTPKTNLAKVGEPYIVETPAQTSIVMKSVKTSVKEPIQAKQFTTGLDLMRLTEKTPSKFIQKQFIKETKTLSPKGVKEVLKAVKKEGGEIYGSFGARQQMPTIKTKLKPEQYAQHLQKKGELIYEPKAKLGEELGGVWTKYDIPKIKISKELKGVERSTIISHELIHHKTLKKIPEKVLRLEGKLPSEYQPSEIIARKFESPSKLFKAEVPTSRVPADIDIQLKVGQTKAETFAKDLTKTLKAKGEQVRISKKSPTLIEANITQLIYILLHHHLKN